MSMLHKEGHDPVVYGRADGVKAYLIAVKWVCEVVVGEASMWDFATCNYPVLVPLREVTHTSVTELRAYEFPLAKTVAGKQITWNKKNPTDLELCILFPLFFGLLSSVACMVRIKNRRKAAAELALMADKQS